MIKFIKLVSIALTFSLGVRATPPASFNTLRRGLLGGIESIVPCLKIENNTCECPGGCMNYNKNSSYPMCVLKECWGWDTDKTECVQIGPSFIPAITLQAIPFTGVFGAGFGNMGRWDLFRVSIAICFIPLLIISICLFCLVSLSSKNYNARTPLIHNAPPSPGWAEGIIKVWVNCFACLWVVAIVSWYIYGIVLIGNKQVKSPNECVLH